MRSAAISWSLYRRYDMLTYGLNGRLSQTSTRSQAPVARILSDKEIRALLGTVIINGDLNCIRPNAYVLRLGAKGEFLNTGKEFNISSDKKGLCIQPGHAVAVTAYETLDFRRETVHKIYPGMISTQWLVRPPIFRVKES